MKALLIGAGLGRRSRRDRPDRRDGFVGDRDGARHVEALGARIRLDELGAETREPPSATAARATFARAIAIASS